MDAVLMSMMICALFVLAGLIERALFATMRWVLHEPLPEFVAALQADSGEDTETDSDPTALIRSSLPA